MTSLLIFILCALIIFSGFVSLSEVALFSLSSSKVRAFRYAQEEKKKSVARLLSSPRDFLITIIMLNVMTNILIQNVTSSLFESFSGWALSVGVPLALTLVFGEVLPKSIGLANNRQISYRVAPFLLWIQKKVAPFRICLNFLTTYISRVMFFFLKQDKEISVDELQHALQASSHLGVVQEDEAELLKGYLHLQESPVKLLMRPREEVLFFDIERPLSELIHFFVDKACSRIPVCQGSLDHVIGIVFSDDFFLRKEEISSSNELTKILSTPFFVPESTPAMQLLKQMYIQKQALSVVVDEYGMVSGIISQEDLIETVVGEIADARDETRLYTRSSEDEIIASGKLELTAFAEIFNAQLTSQNQMVTLGGWLCEQIGDIPKIGTKYIKGNFLFHVLSADPTRVRRIYVRRLNPEGTSP